MMCSFSLLIRLRRNERKQRALTLPMSLQRSGQLPEASLAASWLGSRDECLGGLHQMHQVAVVPPDLDDLRAGGSIPLGLHAQRPLNPVQMLLHRSQDLAQSLRSLHVRLMQAEPGDVFDDALRRTEVCGPMIHRNSRLQKPCHWRCRSRRRIRASLARV